MKVEMIGTEAERSESKRTTWTLEHGKNRGYIRHAHGTPTAFYIETSNRAETGVVKSTDFGDALRLARKMLGVRS